MTRIKIASTAALAALGLASAGLIAGGAGRPEDPKAAMKPANSGPAGRETTTPTSKPGETFELGGVVLSPDGKPVDGATVRLADAIEEVVPTPEAKSGPGGRFTLHVPLSLRDEFPARIADRYPRMVATAPGFAPGWVEGVFRIATVATGWGVTLTEPGPPIEGQVVDLEGRPVAGARVASKDILHPGRGGLPAWVASARAVGVQGIWRDLESVAVGPTVAATDADGRFRMDGPGRDRVAQLLITGPTIATETVYVLGDDLPELRTTDTSWPEPRPLVIHAPRFRHASAPSRPVVGVVRDKDTGRPIEGLRILANIVREADHTMIEGIEARTDAEGRYRLTGLPRAPAYRLFTFPRQGSPYLNGSFVVPASPPTLDAIPFDVALKRGIVVRGRVTDRSTGRPVKANIDVFTFADNPRLGEFPGYSEGYRTNAEVKADGRFEVVAPPGRGIIAARADDALYRGGIGAETIRGPKAGPGSPDDFETRPESISARHYHALAGIDLDPSLDSSTQDLQVDPGRSLSVTAVDPEGQPIGGNLVQGLGDIFQSPRETPSATFEVHALDPSSPRRVTITNEGRKLVGAVLLEGGESGPITVRLQPWGTVVGRVVGDEDRPRPGIGIHNQGGIGRRPSPEEGVLPGLASNHLVQTDADGRFRVEGLIPGLKYGADASQNFNGLGELFRGLIVAPGEVKDLGDLKIQPPKKAEE